MASTTFSGPVTSTNGFVGATTGDVTGNVSGTITLTSYTVTSANALAAKTAGKVIYVSNGANGSAVVAFGNGSAWLRCDTLGALSAT
jgi:hypothetical protein